MNLSFEPSLGVLVPMLSNKSKLTVLIKFDWMIPELIKIHILKSLINSSLSLFPSHHVFIYLIVMQICLHLAIFFFYENVNFHVNQHGVGEIILVFWVYKWIFIFFFVVIAIDMLLFLLSNWILKIFCLKFFLSNCCQ